MQSVSSPGARLVTGQVMADRPAKGSATPIGFRVTLPVFSTLKVYVTMSPSESTPSPLVSASDPVLVRAIDGSAVRATFSVSASVTAGPVGGVPVAVAVLLTEPASTSAWVRV